MMVLTLLRSRLAAYWRIVSGGLSYPLLGIVWAEQFLQTARSLLPRFDLALSTALGTVWGPLACPECDFAAFWPAARLARMGDFSAIYDPARFEAYRQTVFFARIGVLDWFYPPPALLAVLPFGLLPFSAAFYVWTAILTGLAAWLLRLAGLPWTVVAVGILSPASLWNLELGQFGTITGAVLVYALLAAQTAPWRGGFALGALVIKPQTALLAPVAILAGRHWRTLCAAVMSVAGVLVLTTMVFGWPVWRAYLASGLAVSRRVIDAPAAAAGYERFGVSVFWMLRGLGAGIGIANAGQLAAALAAAGLTFTVWRRGIGDRFDRAALAVFLSLLATPYGYVDDMVAFSVVLAILAWRRQWRIDLLDVLFWTWPTLCPLVYGRTGLVLTPVVVGAATARLWVRAGGFRPVPRQDGVAPASQMTV
jgi:hypothetical protein